MEIWFSQIVLKARLTGLQWRLLNSIKNIYIFCFQELLYSHCIIVNCGIDLQSLIEGKRLTTHILDHILFEIVGILKIIAWKFIWKHFLEDLCFCLLCPKAILGDNWFIVEDIVNYIQLIGQFHQKLNGIRHGFSQNMIFHCPYYLTFLVLDQKLLDELRDYFRLSLLDIIFIYFFLYRQMIDENIDHWDIIVFVQLLCLVYF